jgi:hypothetical protein
MSIHSQDIPHALSTPEMSKLSQKEEYNLFPKIPYALPHKDLNQFRIITRAYARQIGALPLALLLPHTKKVSRPVVDTPDQVFVHTVEDLIYFSLTKIEYRLYLILEVTFGNYSEPNNFFDEEGFNSECSVSGSDDMEDNNDHNEERGNPLNKNQPWLAKDALSIHEYITFLDI